ncbi:OLC1v1029814C2 [Oldenlandia corymbosa var. corymbosa]|uniref:OLC1v1029814C2 n=1 Tax=Oldenlandia corymbosa var. corymbosa TaxID=529605 RepID=A0AAV1CGN1_OLDCO|nr:OLC1v1029814C2 [Oldenlandia corymbosa var. corymbosa]
MASDLFVFDNTFFSDPFSSFSDSPVDPHHHHDFFQTFDDNNLNDHSSSSNNINNTSSSIINEENSVDETTITLDQIASALLSSSPPSDQLENLSICQTAHHFQNANHSDYSALEVKTEDYQSSFDAIITGGFSSSSLLNTPENEVRMMQRSYSSNSFDGKPTGYIYHPRFDSLMESPNLQTNPVFTPSETNFSSSSSGQMRRVCSTGDLQMKTTQARTILSSSPLSTEGSFMEEPNFKVGRYSAEERKERIHRYRAKRTQRNFNKTIKYACRKTLADNRPRIRGRFARNDEAIEIPKASSILNRYEDEDDLWVDGYHEEDDEGSSVLGRSLGTAIYNNYGSAPYQYHHYSSY